ncbi:hypothetical protein JI57_02855 [Psychromonas sp. PRT-SC03]|nr:hypothetical protein JI57_02855 [Psychromonas sp. PRT-SC03]
MMRLWIQLPLLFFILLCSGAQASSRISNDSVIIAVTHLPKNFSPYATAPLSQSYSHLFFDPLVRWDQDGKLEKRLLKGWRQIKPGVVRFSLKKNIYFHTGHRLTSDDVLWTYAQIKKGPRFKFFFSDVKKITRVDKLHFDVDSTLSLAQLLDYFSNVFILDKQFYTHLENPDRPFPEIIRSTASKPMVSGTGPYKLQSFNVNLGLKVEPNKDYWDREKGSLPLIFS